MLSGLVATHPRNKTWSGGDEDADWNIYCGDSTEVLATRPSNFYACAITSPPYFWQRDYGVVGQLGLETTIAGYVTSICDAMDGVKRVLRKDGVLFLNLGDTYYSGKGQPKGKDRKHQGRRFSVLRAVDAKGLGAPKKGLLGMPWRVALEMTQRGWILRSSVIWRRNNRMPEPNVRDRPHRSYEFIFMFVKSRTYEFSRTELTKNAEEDVWTIESTSRTGREHPAVFPEALVERCLAIGNPRRGRVLDPFAGSGTVLRVAMASGISADGVELNPKFCRSAAMHLSSMT